MKFLQRWEGRSLAEGRDSFFPAKVPGNIQKDYADANGYDENAPRGQCTLDRIDVNGNYEPSNCRWVDLFAQANNKRNSTHISINGESKTLSEWCRIYGTNPSRVRARMNSGWDLERAITTPIRKINKYE